MIISKKVHIELFHTKIFRLENPETESESAHQLLTISRDPGSAATLISVIKILSENPDMNVSVVTDGRAEDAFRNSFPDLISEEDVGKPVGADKALPTPDVILADASEEKGLDTYANATYQDVPMVLIEDFPGSCVKYLETIKERPGLRMSDKVCVMDEVARQSLISKFPELADAVIATGQPAFDRIAKENISEISARVREGLGMQPEEKVIAFMSTDEVTSAQFEQILSQITSSNSNFKLIFRRHPRDNTTYEQYFDILQRYGVDPIDSREFKTDEISAAADVVFTSWSAAGLEAIYRGKPTVHIVDSNVLPDAAGLDLPLAVVRLGASVGVTDISEIPSNIDQLLDPESDLSKSLGANMEKYYPNDGKNAQRVASVVETIVSQNHDL